MEQIDEYNVLKIIESGNITQTILVEKLGIKYILKLALRSEYNPYIIREYFMLKLLHPLGFAPKPISLGKTGKKLYFTREWIEGVTIKEYLQDKDEKIKFLYMQKVYAIVYQIHIRGIILVDISPSNIFVDMHGKVIILDLGLAIFMDSGGNIHAGTFPYIAPELIYNIPSIKYPFKIDVFSLGAIFYEIFTNKPPYNANNFDELLIRQHEGLPQMTDIQHVHAKDIISKSMAFYPEDRPSLFTIIKEFDELPLKEYIVPKEFPIIFTDFYADILKKLRDPLLSVINVFSAHYPDGFSEYIENDFKIRLESEGLKVDIDKDDSKYTITVCNCMSFENPPKNTANTKVLILSSFPIRHDKPVQYINFEFIYKEEAIKEVFGYSLPSGEFASDNIPLYVRTNLKILEHLDSDAIIPHPISIKNVAFYIYTEYNDLVDFLNNYVFAVPKTEIHINILEEYASKELIRKKSQQQFNVLSILEAFGFVIFYKAHIILTPIFDRFLRGEVKMQKLAYRGNIRGDTLYDRLEKFLRKSRDNSDGLMQEVEEIISRKDMPRTHIKIFLDKLSDLVSNPECRHKLLNIKISLGFWESAKMDWEKFKKTMDKPLSISYARAALGMGKYQDAVSLLTSIGTKEAKSMLLYAHAIHGRFNLLQKMLKEDHNIKRDAYYFIAMGFYELYKRNTALAKNYAIKAEEFSGKDSHAKFMSQYLYGVSLLMETQWTRAIKVFEDLLQQWQYPTEELLAHFQTGYLYYKLGQINRSIYHFAYSYLLSREFNDLLFSVQAAFYLGYVYHRNNKLSVAYNYWKYTHRYLKFLDRTLHPAFYQKYFEVLIQLDKYELAKKLLEKEPVLKEHAGVVTLATFYFKQKSIEDLMDLKKRPLSEGEKELVEAMLNTLKNEKRR